MVAKVNVIWHVDNLCCKPPIFWHFESSFADVLVILTTDTLSAHINQQPYNHSIIRELNKLMTSRKEIAHFWEDWSRVVRSLFYHKKLPYGPIRPRNILTIFTPQNKVALRMISVTLASHTTGLVLLYLDAVFLFLLFFSPCLLLFHF